jgi:DNA-binding transcriptional ArsR family regulator
LSTTLAAVADPTRRSILRRLANGPATVGEIAEPFRMSQQAVSKHLAYLERARLIAKRRDGRENICSLDLKPLESVADWAQGLREAWEANFQRLDALLDELKTQEKKRKHR